MNTESTLIAPPEEAINNPQIRFNEHGHRVYEPSRGSEYRKRYGHSKRQGNKVRAIMIADGNISQAAIPQALNELRIITKSRKSNERIAKRKKHHEALSKR